PPPVLGGVPLRVRGHVRPDPGRPGGGRGRGQEGPVSDLGANVVPHALLLSLALFAVGAVGVFLRRNLITVFMCVELMLNAVNLSFVAFSRQLGTLDAQILVFFVLPVAAAEAAVGLAIIIAIHRQKDTLDADAFSLLRW